MSATAPRSVLETDFPLLTPPPTQASVPAEGSYGQYRYHRSPSSGYGSSSLQRAQQQTTTATATAAAGSSTQGGYRPLSAYLNSAHSPSSSSSTPNRATDWRYHSVGAGAGAGTGPGAGQGRAGSLKRAYDEDDKDGGGGVDEQQPLVEGGNRPSPQRSQISSTTSDYHSSDQQQQQQQQQQPLLSEAKKEPIEVALKKQQQQREKEKGEERRKRTESGRNRRHHHPDYNYADDDAALSGCAGCWFGLLVALAQVFLFGATALCLYWIVHYHTPKDKETFAWSGNDARQLFNLHPTLMVSGLVFFVGQAALTFRTCRCCRRMWNKVLHAASHLLAAPCAVGGFMAVLASRELRAGEGEETHFYSLHAWMGLATLGIFALQFLVGFFSFVFLSLCGGATSSFRAALAPIHSAFGCITFVLAAATACAGITEKAVFQFGSSYNSWVPWLLSTSSTADEASREAAALASEALTMNALGAALVVLAVVVPFVVAYPRFRNRDGGRVVNISGDRYG